MAISYTATAYNSNGTVVATARTYKDVVVTVGNSDLIVATGHSANTNGSSGGGNIQTQAGSTGAWTVEFENSMNESPGFVIGHAVASAAGSVTVRVTVPNAASTFNMGASVWVIPAAEWSGVPEYTTFGPNISDATPFTVLSDTAAIVLYSGADWSAAGTPGAGLTPSGGVSDTVSFVSGNYGSALAHWTGQGSGGRDYGPSAPAGNSWTGAVFVVSEQTGPPPPQAEGTLHQLVPRKKLKDMARRNT